MPDYLTFASEFLHSPMVTASPVPTSVALSDIAVAPVPERGEPVVLELGAGTGSTSEVVQRHLGGRGRHLAVEANPRMARLLRREYPEVEVICRDAREVVRRLSADGVRVDLVFSTLPISVTAPPATTIFAELGALLSPTGAVTQIQHSWVRPLPIARQVRRNLETHFEEVLISRTVWHNPPPAVVYLARRPRPPVP